jgi:hypothetical protein
MKMMKPRFEWIHIGTSIEGQIFKIDEVDLWGHNWINLNEKTKIHETTYNQDFDFPIYKIETNSKTILFAAGEFSNGVFGFYQKYDNLTKTKV